MRLIRNALTMIALFLPMIGWSQITTLPSPACATPTASIYQGSNITLSWVAPTKNGDGSTITGALTYNLYSLGGTNPVLLVSGITGTSTVRTNLSIGTPCYAVTSVAGGVESAVLSNTASIKVVAAPPPTPLPPSGVTCTLNIPSGGGPVTGNCATQ